MFRYKPNRLGIVGTGKVKTRLTRWLEFQHFFYLFSVRKPVRSLCQALIPFSAGKMALEIYLEKSSSYLNNLTPSQFMNKAEDFLEESLGPDFLIKTIEKQISLTSFNNVLVDEIRTEKEAKAINQLGFYLIGIGPEGKRDFVNAFIDDTDEPAAAKRLEEIFINLV